MFGRSGYSKFDTESEHGEENIPSIQFIGVGRINEKQPILISSYSHHSKTDLESVKSVLNNLEFDKYYIIDAGNFEFSLLTNERGIVYIVINRINYPQRCTQMCIEELKLTFESKFLNQSLTAKEDSLSRLFKDQSRKLCVKYNNVADVDAIASAKKKIESVKLVMEKNIELALQNCVKIEHIDKVTDDLIKKAEVFKISSSSVKTRMWWKNIKTKVIIGCVVLLLIGILIGVLCYLYAGYKSYSHSNGDDQYN